MGFNSGFKGLKAIDIQYNEMALSKKKLFGKGVWGGGTRSVLGAEMCSVSEREPLDGTQLN